MRTSSAYPSGSSVEGRRFLQQRIALFGKVVFILCFGFYVVAHGLILATSLEAWPLTARPTLAHLAASALLGLIWFVAGRERLLSLGSLGALDALGTIAVATIYAFMWRPEFDSAGIQPILLATTNTLATRAVLVPSTAARTFGISLLAALPLAVVAALQLGYSDAPVASVLGLQMMFVGVWMVLAIAVATVASQIIYGLRQEVKEAQMLGQYTLQEKLGEGGMGQVFRASHAMLRRPTAIKLLRADMAGESSLRRFEREVQLTSQLTHPNTIAIHDYGRTPDGVFYYAMEYLDGIDLQDLVRDFGPQPAGRVRDILAQVCGALSEAHGVGLIHRDIKPANIILCQRGGVPDFAKIVDFGLVKDLGSGLDPMVSHSDTLTGTPLYMSPELIASPDQVDGRSDLYSLAAVGYFLLSGEPLFAGKSIIEVCTHHLRTPAPALSGRIPGFAAKELERVLLSCLEKEPTGRPPSAAALRSELLGCEGLDDWTEPQAYGWWDRFRKRERPRRAHGTTVSLQAAPTVAVDLKRREAGLTQ